MLVEWEYDDCNGTHDEYRAVVGEFALLVTEYADTTRWLVASDDDVEGESYAHINVGGVAPDATTAQERAVEALRLINSIMPALAKLIATAEQA